MRAIRGLVIAAALLAAGAAHAASTINPNIPTTNAPLQSLPIRNNFLAAATDVNNLLGKFGGTTAPNNPSTFQDWVNTGTTPYQFNFYDGAQWVTWGYLNASTHTFQTAASCSICAVTNATNTFTAYQIIDLNTATLQAAQTGTMLQVGNANGVVSRIEADAFAAAAHFTGIRADGTAASPTTLQSGDAIASFNAWGYDGSAFVGPQAAFRCYADQNWVHGSALGTRCDVAVTPDGSTTLTEALLIGNNGVVSLNTLQALSGTLTLNAPLGFVFGTGSGQTIVANSTNTGFGNQFEVANTGTASNSGTIANLLLNLNATSNAYLDVSVTGGASPAATILSGTALTGGLTIQATAGNLTLDGSLAFALGSDATGDIWYRNSSGLVTRLGIGSSGNVLTVSGGIPAWESGSTNFVDSLGNYSADSTLTITGTGSGPWTGAVTIKCTVGTSSQVGCLKPDGTIITVSSGAITVAKATNVAFGAMEGDGTTISCSSGVCSSVGGVATLITPGTTTIVGATAPCVISNTTSTTMGCGAETGTGNFVLSASPTLSGTVGGNLTFGGTMTITGALTLSTPATTAQIWAGTAGAALDAGNVFNAAGTAQALSGTTSISTDFENGFNWKFTATSADNYTLNNPTNMKEGQAGCFYLTQPATGTVVTIAFGNEFYFAGGTTPSLTATLGALDLLCYQVGVGGSYLVANMLNNVKS